MNVRRLILPWCTVVVTAATCFGEGITYPNGSVSIFTPGFFGVGIPEPATSSRVFGLAAKGETFIAAVGQINGLEDDAGQEPYLFLPGGFRPLPRATGYTNTGTASVISADGKIKVGDGGGSKNGGYWDAGNQFHPLPLGASDAVALALAITPDGSVIAGSVLSATGVPDEFEYEVALWTPGGTGVTRRGKLPGFQNTIVTGIARDGSTVCGYANKFDGGNSSTRAFTQYGDNLPRSLGTLAGNADTAAYGISELGDWIVGASGFAGAEQAFAWTIFGGISALEGSQGRSAGYAVRLTANSPSGTLGRIVGFNGDFTTGDTAFMWNGKGQVEGTILGLLINTYKKAIGPWHLSAAYAISDDGLTVAGFGTNPQGKQEGWVALLPEILHPPLVDKPLTQSRVRTNFSPIK
jgi:uncharacterized membrane protein